MVRIQQLSPLVGSGMASTSLFAIELVSYLPEETICSPRKVVNETVKAREAPTNWNIRFFHGVSRNLGESGAQRCSLGALRSATLSRFYSLTPCRGPSPKYVAPTSHRLSHKPRHFSFSTCSSFRFIL